MTYRDIVNRYAGETARLSEEIPKLQEAEAAAKGAEDLRRIGIDAKLRELVDDEELLKFLEARNASAVLADSPEGHLVSLVSSGHAGSIKLHYRDGDKYAKNFSLYKDARRQLDAHKREEYSQFISGDGSAFMNTETVRKQSAPLYSETFNAGDYERVLTMLAEHYRYGHFKDQTAETLEATLTESLEEIAQKTQSGST